MASNSVFNEVMEGVTGPAELYDTSRFQTISESQAYLDRRSVGQEGAANTPDVHEFRSPGKRPPSPFRHETETIKSASGIPKVAGLIGNSDYQLLGTRAR